jgi:hypothetical protein
MTIRKKSEYKGLCLNKFQQSTQNEQGFLLLKNRWLP